MVWRDSIKVLEVRTKAFALIVSTLMHIAAVFVLRTVDYNNEKVFTVDLVFEDKVGNLGLKVRSGAHEDRITKKTVGRLKNHDTALPIQQRELPSEGMDIKTAVAYKPDTLPKDNKQDPLGEYARDISTSSYMGEGYKGEVGISDGLGEGIDLQGKWNNPVNTIVEGEIGSINGPSFLKMVKPEYPRLARRLGKEGKVLLRLFIDEHGRLLNVEVVEKAGFGFDESAINAVKASTFLPARLNGYPVACKALLPVRFKLE